MYEVTIRQHFDAAHYLREYGGRCENLHGHRYEVEVSLEAGELNNIGLAFDFTQLKAALGTVLVRFDHKCLNEVEPFDGINPSAENIARTIFEALSAPLAGGRARLAWVRVYESPDSWATYRP
ncbi:MAG: 6-carboxytetrahydropterin synthase QueD [Bacteroidetes bacterium]|nr:6-carboxytetrahydropterin synthase QueD [Bacteroidota bacterium]MCL5025690.1 6-carboxytetrahydropterin synthase QueD [Chloroflexota bacterium]